MLDRIAAGLASLIYKIWGMLTSAGSQFSLTSLFCALAIGAGFLAVQHFRRRGRLRLRVVLRALFPHRMLFHPSSKADVGYFLFNTFVYGATFGLAGVSYQFLTNGILQSLIAVAGPVAPSSLPDVVQRGAVTAILFFAYELGYWMDHYLKHRVPFLWEVHKVHHTAEVLTPLTSARMHPLDSLVFGHILAVTAAAANGITAYLFGDTSHQYALSGTNIILVVFIHLYVHLQHTHLWIAFRGLLGRVLLSPAHHQIHHSTNPVHFNKNLGSCLAVWDWAFGTLHIPSQQREKLKFGLEPTHADAHTITGEFVAPFGRAAAAVIPRARNAGAPAAEPAAN